MIVVKPAKAPSELSKKELEILARTLQDVLYKDEFGEWTLKKDVNPDVLEESIKKVLNNFKLNTTVVNFDYDVIAKIRIKAPNDEQARERIAKLANWESIEVFQYFEAVPPPPTEKVLEPKCFPEGGVFSGIGSAILVSGTPNAKIHYTTNGKTPTEDSAIYMGPILLSGTTTIKAIAFCDDMLPSEEVTIEFMEEKLPPRLAQD